ncbi:MAG: type II toxin-antitoxin system RelB/DinJ family antitoxin [Clostridiales bacterium]|nr:type II toxin-antitoxin system RelB/DinJ family antitoxin [Clostridiales bacterium]
MATTNLNIRIDKDLKKQAEAIFNELGLNMSTALTVFLRQTVRSNGIPFELRLDVPNDETLEALEEVQRMKKNPSLGKEYTDVDKMMRELLS